jgi:hypothetical protein
MLSAILTAPGTKASRKLVRNDELRMKVDPRKKFYRLAENSGLAGNQ